MTYISWSSDIVLYLEDYFGIMGQYDPTFDLKINVGLGEVYFWSSDFVLSLQDYLMHECDIFRYM